jgi:hypothetical protein
MPDERAQPTKEKLRESTPMDWEAPDAICIPPYWR